MKIDKIKDLMACKIIDIGRVIDLCWIIFEKEEKCYSLHLQCPWRIRKDGLDIKLILSDSYIFECFVDDARNECWRFFKKGDSEHLVVCGSGIEQ